MISPGGPNVIDYPTFEEMECPGVYLIHFDRPYQHAVHYTGWAADIATRVQEHLLGTGSPLVDAANKAGIGWEVSRIWKEADRNWERRLKDRHTAREYCPRCINEYRRKARQRMQAVRAEKQDVQPL